MQNLTKTLDLHARLRPDAEALIYDDVRVTWRGLQARVRETAAGLHALGVGPDTIVALLMKNSAAFFDLVYAISHLGGVALPLNYRLSGPEINYIVTHAGAAMIIVDDELQGVAADLDLKVLTLDAASQKDSRERFGGRGAYVKASPRAGGDIYRLMYTSGTTDRPKGVVHTYDNFYWKSLDHIVALQLTADARLGVVGPLYHVGASDLPGFGAHVAGGCMIVLRDYDPRKTVEMIARESITGIWMAPVMTSGVLQLDRTPSMDSLRWCVGGGERTPEGRIRDFSRVFPNARYIDAFGMTETMSGDTFMEPGREIEKIGSVGRPLAFVDVEIRDESGASLPPGAEGELCIAGPKVTRGYWKDPDLTAAATFPDGYLRSGDVGYVDDDGFLYLTDRKKDMIISGGENIASSEVERVIYELDQVAEAAVVGRPDEKWGEVPVAFVVLRPGGRLSFADLDAHCRPRLAGYKRPKELFLAASLPRNPSGKILKRKLRDQISAVAENY
ncbi:MAG: acyl-CoA synthetase [Rhizobiales bacterium 65-9]|nr:AMP-binding protein [Hyphomicrobiales bacterium]OJY40198.1 MAG: acyl-CoA synthetase [Rhizobiales bacterium 65-9]